MRHAGVPTRDGFLLQEGQILGEGVERGGVQKRLEEVLRQRLRSEGDGHKKGDSKVGGTEKGDRETDLLQILLLVSYHE